jgi:hypothetical protein
LQQIKVKVSSEFESNLEEILSSCYTQTVSFRLLDDLKNKISFLRDFPQLGKKIPGDSDDVEIRYVYLKPYVIMYIYEQDVVTLYKMVHEKLDYTSFILEVAAARQEE